MALVIDEWTKDNPGPNDISPREAKRLKKQLQKGLKKGTLQFKIDAQMKWRLCAARLMRAQFLKPWCWDGYEYRSNWALNHHKAGEQWRPRWEGGNCDLRVLAEQGIGDEILYASVYDELIRECPDVTIEVDSRLLPVFRRAFEAKFTSRWIFGDEDRRPPAPEDYDKKKIGFGAYVCAADLLARYRTGLKPPGTSYLSADPNLTARFKLLLAELGEPPYIGIAWSGGRSLLEPENLKKQKGTYVSVQYKNLGKNQYGVPMIGSDPGPDWVNYIDVDHNDMEQIFALCNAMDYVITVQSYIVHVCGSTGVKCIAIKPPPQFGPVGFDDSSNNRMKWAYGTSEDPSWDHPWYNSVTVYKSWRHFQNSGG